MVVLRLIGCRGGTVWLPKDKKVVSISSLDDPLAASLTKVCEKLGAGAACAPSCAAYKVVSKAAATKWKGPPAAIELTPALALDTPLSSQASFENGEFLFVAADGVLPAWAGVAGGGGVRQPSQEVPPPPSSSTRPLVPARRVEPASPVVRQQAQAPPPSPVRPVQTYQQHNPAPPSPVHALPSPQAQAQQAQQARAVEAMRAQLLDMQQQLAEASERERVVASQSAEIEALNSQLHSARRDAEDARAEAAGAQLRASEAQQQAEDAGHSIAALREELHLARTASINDKASVIDLKEQIADMMCELEAVRCSRAERERAADLRAGRLEEDTARLRLQLGSRDRTIASLQAAADELAKIKQRRKEERTLKDQMWKPAAAAAAPAPLLVAAAPRHPVHDPSVVAAAACSIAPHEDAARRRILAEEAKCRGSLKAFCSTPLAWLRAEVALTSERMASWGGIHSQAAFG